MNGKCHYISDLIARRTESAEGLSGRRGSQRINPSIHADTKANHTPSIHNPLKAEHPSKTEPSAHRRDARRHDVKGARMGRGSVGGDRCGQEMGRRIPAAVGS